MTELYKLKHSQNFIKSDKLSADLINLTTIKPKDLVVEIGPGKGSLTEHIINKGAKIIAVELDENLAENLKNLYSGKDIKIINQDFLNFQLPDQDYKLVGNIPFALTTKIIKKILDPKSKLDEAYLIMQKEAAFRLMGNDLHALKVKPWFSFKITRRLKAEDFLPIPAVTPIFLKISKYDSPRIDSKDRDEYSLFLTYCFLNSKSGIKSSLKKIFTFTQLGILSKKYNLKSKPRELGFEKWVSLFQEYKRLVNEDKKRFVRDSAKSFESKLSGIQKVYRSRSSRRNT